MIVYGLSFFDTDRAFADALCIYRLSKIPCKYCPDKGDQELEKCQKEYIVFKGTASIKDLLDYVLQFKAELKRVDNTLLHAFFTY